jgi:hypothetical protein
MTVMEQGGLLEELHLSTSDIRHITASIDWINHA